MSQTRVLNVEKGTTTRHDISSGANEGCGNSKRFYFGRRGGKDYDSYVKFTLDWSLVGRIVSATLVTYTDDGGGLIPTPGSGATPKLRVRRLLDGFTEGNNADGTFNSSDYTTATGTSSRQSVMTISKVPNGLNRLDITGIMEDIAPATVQRRDGTPGGKASNYGLGFFGYGDTDWDGCVWSEDATDASKRPTIELVFEYGVTTPDVPTNLAPSGAQASFTSFSGDFTDIDAADKLAYSEVEVYTSVVTNTGQTINLNGGSKLYTSKQRVTTTEELASHFTHFPDATFSMVKGVTYKWRVRVYDQEAAVSLWTDLVSTSVTNTAPNAPTLTPAAQTYASLDGVLFSGGTFSDPDAGDTLSGFQVQLSPFAGGDPRWDDPSFLSWDTGKVYVGTGVTGWSLGYGGSPLVAGTYYWRARVFDNTGAASAWSYTTITTTADFVAQPGDATSVQVRPQAPWRIVIRGLGANRGPGAVLAILEDAHNVGGTILDNSPGEAHWTLPIDHPQVAVIEPKQTHYAIEFYQDGWREVYAGLVWDFDATDTDVIFKGIDYLGLYDFTQDERYDPANPDRSSDAGGSKYVNKTITQVITSQLTLAKTQPDSIVGFINVGAIASMTENVTIWTTMVPTLQMVTGLIDSHKQGQGTKTRVMVRKAAGGTYEVVVLADPGEVRDNMRLRFGELVSGYRIIPFGDQWASRVNVIGRTREGLKVMYKSANAPGIDQATWGRISQARLVEDIADENDLVRRNKQLAIEAGKFGRNMALGIRAGAFGPLDGYEIADSIPVDVVDGVVNTAAYGSGYWTCKGVTWEAGDQGQQAVILTLLPREDAVAPDPDLIPSVPLSTTEEFQIGWTPPNPLDASSQYWLDNTTGIIYFRGTGTIVASGITGDV